MRITGIDCHVLLAPNFDKALTSSAQDSFIVAVHTDAGITGWGESDVNPWIAKACVDAPGTHTMSLSLRDILIGSDPKAPIRSDRALVRLRCPTYKARSNHAPSPQLPPAVVVKPKPSARLGWRA